MHDLFNNVVQKRALNAQVINADTTTAGAIIDRAGYESVLFLIDYGTLTTGTCTVLIEEDDNASMTSAAAVADADLIGTEAGASSAATDDNKVGKVGYKGNERYVRLSIVSASSANVTVGAIALLGKARVNPNTTQLQA